MARVPVLDHGYVEYVEHWGSDERIIEAARMSTGKGFLGWGPTYGMCNCGADCSGPTAEAHTSGCPATKEVLPGDMKLLRYLWTNKHATPFEMGGMVVEVQAPIFVFREWHRHRTQSYNEMSARYVPLPDVNYVPSVNRLMMAADRAKDKQAGAADGASALTVEKAKNFRECLKHVYKLQQNVYDGALRDGVPKELARVHLPVGRYSRMRASANLRNWLAFLTLRMADNAQWEIRQYANVVCGMLQERFPRTLALFLEGK